MKNTLKALLLLSLTLAFWTAAPYAQATDPTKASVQTDGQAQVSQWLNYLSGELNLDTEQKNQIQSTLVAAANSLQAIKTQAGTQTADDLITEVNKSIEAVLKPEQKTKFSQIGDTWKARFKG